MQMEILEISKSVYQIVTMKRTTLFNKFNSVDCSFKNSPPFSKSATYTKNIIVTVVSISPKSPNPKHQSSLLPISNGKIPNHSLTQVGSFKPWIQDSTLYWNNIFEKITGKKIINFGKKKDQKRSIINWFFILLVHLIMLIRLYFIEINHQNISF